MEYIAHISSIVLVGYFGIVLLIWRVLKHKQQTQQPATKTSTQQPTKNNQQQTPERRKITHANKEQVLREINQDVECLKKLYDEEEQVNKRAAELAASYVPEPTTYSDSIYGFKENNPWLSSFLLVKLNEFFEQQWGYRLTEKEKAVVLAAFNSATKETMFDIEAYFKNNPIISIMLLKRFATFYNEKRSRGEQINLAEVKTFIFTANLFGG